MATGENEPTSQTSRKSSVSSGARAANNKLGTIRTKHPPNDARRPRTPSNTEESSLTSFPSLSPSIANSPVSSPHDTQLLHFSSVPADGDEATQKAPQRPLLDGLFAGSHSITGRSALFEDARKNARSIPGTLHLQDDQHLQHLISRVGAVNLVKQMAEDVAQRDAQITQLQRRAEERERLLRKMLRECEVSNLKIEARLKEFESEQIAQEQSRKVSGQSQLSDSGFKSDASIDEQMSEAFTDILGSNERRNGVAERPHVSKVSGTSSTAESRRTSTETSVVSSQKSETVRKRGTNRGWKSLFSGQVNQSDNLATIKGPLQRTASAQERLQRIHTASQANMKRKKLTTDLFEPPAVEADSLKTRRAPLTNAESQNVAPSANGGNNAASTTSSNSLSSWATRLVAGKSHTSSTAKNHLNQMDEVSKTASKTTGNALPSKRRQSNASKSKVAVHLPISADANKQITRKLVSAIESNTPTGQVISAEANPGPMEMDTILPDNSRPPTLLPYESTGEHCDYLTDRYGFIYDQRRRARQHIAISNKNQKKRNSRVETLENHRRSWHSLANADGDAASLKSQQSNGNTDAAPASPLLADSVLEQHPPKRWQDYLKLSNLSSELLSHTPSLTPLTNIITADEHVDDDQKPQIKISAHGSIISPTSNPAPSPSHVISGDAELAQSAQSIDSDVTATEDESQSNDPVKALLDQLIEIHDASQKEKETRWHDFLRRIRADRRRQGEAYTHDRRSKSIPSAPEATWMDGEIIGITSLGIEGKAGKAKWLEFKNLLLGGIPLSLRPKIWSECSGALSSRAPGYYEELVRSQPQDEVVVQQIAMDIPRTLTDNIYFRQGEGMAKLSEVLLAYAQHNPDVGYCQGMNLITANLLLIMPAAEDAFWMLTTLVEKILPDKYYDHSLLTSRADQTVLRQYVGTVLPKLSSHLNNLNVDLEALTFQWFLSVFTDCLSAEALFRVWDVLLCVPADGGGGATFLFQVALALLKLNESQLLDCQIPAEIYAYINGKMTDHAISIDGLIRASEALRRVVRKEDVEKKRDVVVQDDLEAMQQREAVRKGKARAAGIRDAPASEKSRETASEEEYSEVGHYAKSTDEDRLSDADDLKGTLAYMSPLPVEEEVQWRG